MVKPWFRDLYQIVDRWYRTTYGAAMETKASIVAGIVRFRGTPLLVRIPTSVVRPADEKDHRWVSFPDHVGPDEDVLSWLVTPPNIVALDAGERAALEADIRSLASDLRFIRSRLGSADPSPADIEGFTSGVTKHLCAFAELLVAGDEIAILKSWWELQMAMESVLKGLLLQKTGAFRKVHPLLGLVALAKPLGLSFDEGRFATWPAPAEMSERRYGRGTRTATSAAYEGYRLALDLCREAAKLYGRKADIGKASFLTRTPVWMKRSDSQSRTGG